MRLEKYSEEILISSVFSYRKFYAKKNVKIMEISFKNNF